VRNALKKLEIAIMTGPETPQKPQLGIQSPGVRDLLTVLTMRIGQEQAETLAQLAVRDCDKKQSVDGAIGPVTTCGINSIPEHQFLQALRLPRRKEPKMAYHCKEHPDTELICPVCRASEGGKTTAKRYSSEQMSTWGKLGGRPRKPKKPKAEEKSA